MGKKNLSVNIFSTVYIVAITAATVVTYYYEDLGWIFLIVLGVIFILGAAKYIRMYGEFANYKEASAAKSRFLSKFSHDFRTPMNAIIGMTEIAGQSVNDPKEVAYCLNKISTSADYMLAMLSDILDISKIESGRLELVDEPFDMSELIKSINAIIYVQASNNQVLFTVKKKISSDILLIGDSIRVKQVLVNLLSNAVKFTREGGKVQFGAEETLRNDDTVHMCFRIMDNGIGMSQEFMEIMYEPFECEKDIRKHSNPDGVGLGLAICRNLVELMGGTIQARSRLGEGTEFVVDVDFKCVCKSTNSRQRVDNTIVKYDFTGRRVLIADDNLTNLDIATRLLQRVGIEVDIATDGQKVVNRYLDSPIGYYDAILLDIQMPVKNGLKVAAEIRRSNRLDASSVPIAAMTAHAFAEDKEEAARHGMNFYLTKPIKMQVLYASLDEIFAKKSTARVTGNDSQTRTSVASTFVGFPENDSAATAERRDKSGR